MKAAKLTIKNFKGLPNITDEYVQNEMCVLQKAVQSIQQGKTLQKYLEELYRSVEILCTYNFHDTLFKNLYFLIESYLMEVFYRLHPIGTDLLQKLVAEWKMFCEQICLIRNIFLCLDRSLACNKYKNIWSVGLNLFKNIIVCNPSVRVQLMNDLLLQIRLERLGDSLDKELIKNVLSILEKLQVYDEIFMEQFLESTVSFYALESDAIFENYCIYNYLKCVNKRISDETKRAVSYLNESTGRAVADIVYKYLVENQLQKILIYGLEDLLEKNEIQELSLLYKLLKCVKSGTNQLEESFSEYLMKHGSRLVLFPENDKVMIQNLLNFKNKTNNIVIQAFENSENFQEVVRHSFAQFINKRHNKPAELLAKYVDTKMRSKDLTEPEIETALQEVMVLFRLIQGKDVFEAFYKMDLAKRLLLGRSSSQDIEKSMISKLKVECGGHYTAKLEGMFRDINISRGINQAFKQYLVTHHEKNTLQTVDLCINILTSSFWPNYPIYNVNLPNELVSYQQIFQKFYLTNQSGRKLLWQPNLGHCILKAVFNTCNKELQVSLFQTIVLLLFNESAELTYKEIKQLTNLDASELNRTLISLACGKSRVLIKKPKGIEIQDDDKFIFNADFKDKLFRIKINQIQLKETVEEQQATEKSVIQDRQFQIDAAIVRIMKKHKSMNHNNLISQLYNVLDVPVGPVNLKKRIEQLIEREYIERDKDNPSCYKYVA